MDNVILWKKLIALTDEQWRGLQHLKVQNMVNEMFWPHRGPHQLKGGTKNGNIVTEYLRITLVMFLHCRNRSDALKTYEWAPVHL